MRKGRGARRSITLLVGLKAGKQWPSPRGRGKGEVLKMGLAWRGGWAQPGGRDGKNVVVALGGARSWHWLFCLDGLQGSAAIWVFGAAAALRGLFLAAGWGYASGSRETTELKEASGSCCQMSLLPTAPETPFQSPRGWQQHRGPSAGRRHCLSPPSQPRGSQQPSVELLGEGLVWRI